MGPRARDSSPPGHQPAEVEGRALQTGHQPGFILGPLLSHLRPHHQLSPRHRPAGSQLASALSPHLALRADSVQSSPFLALGLKGRPAAPLLPNPLINFCIENCSYAFYLILTLLILLIIKIFLKIFKKVTRTAWDSAPLYLCFEIPQPICRQRVAGPAHPSRTIPTHLN